MRRGFAVLIVAACGGGQPVNNENVHLDKPDAAVVALPNKPVQPLGIPHGAPFVLSVDATALARIVPLRTEIEHQLDIPTGALVEQAGSLGFDAKRPVTLAIAPLEDTQAKLVADLRTQFADPNVQPSDDVIRRIASLESPIMIRILIPATNAQKLEQTFAKLLEGDRWHKTANGFSKHGDRLYMDDDGQSVAVDVIVSHEHAGEPKAYRAFAAAAHDPPPALDGRTARATWSPQAVATIGYLSGVIRAAGAVSGASVDASQRTRIMREGLTEAASGFALADFERIDVEGRLEPFEFVGRAKPGAGFVMPPADAFAQSTGVAPGGNRGLALIQASRAFVRGWPFPGGSVKTALDSIRNGGGGAALAGVPHLLAMLPLIESRRSRAMPAFDLSRFERVGTAFDQGNEAFISIMPAGTKRADAECAFAPKTPCDAKTKLKLNVAVKVEDLTAKLYEIDKRFVVVSSSYETAKLDAPPLAQVAGMHVDGDTTMLASFLAPNTLPAKVSGEITSESGTLVFRAH